MEDTGLVKLKEFSKTEVRKSIRYTEDMMDFINQAYKANKSLSAKNLSDFYFLLWDFRNRVIQKYFKQESQKYIRYPKHFLKGIYKKQNILFLEEVISKNPSYINTVTIPNILVNSFKNLQEAIAKEAKLNSKNLYITQKDGDFYINNKFIKFSKKAEHYKLFEAIYSLVPSGGMVPFSILKKALPKLSKELVSSDTKFKKHLQNNLTDKHSGFFKGRDIEKELNGKPLLLIPRGTTSIQFNNKFK